MATRESWRIRVGFRRLFAVMFSMIMPVVANGQGVFVQKVRVQQESKLDWQFAAEQMIPRRAVSERMEEYQWRRQLYDLFGPRVAPPRALPLILFISPGKVPREWDQFAPVCRKHGILFAGVRDAGNGQDPAVRMRAAIEVLDDVRGLYHIDPDRTYVAGFSGGAVVAGRLAFAMPECFGGLLCIGQRVFLPRDRTLIDRAGERIHIAALCGGNELVGPEVEHIDQRLADANGFRCRTFVSRGKGHRMPKAGMIEAALEWLEEGVDQRKQLSEKYGSTRLGPQKEYDAESWRSALIEEAEQRWNQKQYVEAVRLLEWVATRWPESSAASTVAAKARTFKQRPEFIDDLSSKAQNLRASIDEALVTGCEKLANDRRAWFTSERRSQFADRAIRLIEETEVELADQPERLAKLREIAGKGKK